MPYAIKIAWRNLTRQRGRTILSVAAIAAGVAAVCVTKGFADGMIGTIITNSVNLSAGHVRVIDPQYRLKERLLSLAYPIGEHGPGYENLVRDLRGLPEAAAAMGRIRFGMLLVSGDKQRTVMGVGADLPAEDRVAHLGRYLRADGRFPEPGQQEIVLGQKILAELGLAEGDKINAVFSTSFGSFKIATFKIVGVMASGLEYLDKAAAYIPLDVAMNLLDLEDAVTEVVVFAPALEDTPRLRAAIEDYLADRGLDYQAVPWHEHNEILAFIGKASGIYTLIYVFLALLSSFVVFNTMTMIVSERTREIGMLAVLGFTPRGIRRLFLAEGLAVALLGSAIGAAGGGFLNWLLSQVGLDLSAYTETSGEAMMLLPRLYPSFNPADLAFAALLGVAVTLAAVYLPARRAARLKPAEALRVV